jgi:hypothetical protein
MIRVLCLMLVGLAACTSHVGGPSPHGEHRPSPFQAAQVPEPSNASVPLVQPQPQECAPCNLAQSVAEVSICSRLVPGQSARKDKRGKTISPGTMCQPQSLVYARCRSGIRTCQLGNTSPEGWFACAAQHGATTATPHAGSVMVLAANAQRKMYTGHPVYVEEVCPEKDGSWRLRISHTNYDRRCHLDHNAWVRFFPQSMTASFQTGPWAPWAKNLRVLGFILR